MQNTERFTGRVMDYERYRMRFPAAVLEEIREHCGLLPADVIADVGAGTGMLAELFLEAGHAVIAVEPNAEMRAACDRLTARFERLRVVDATAEATGLADASIDLVSVGRAFHWFDQERAIAEFTRVLKPGGWVVLVTNRRSGEASPQMREYEIILRGHWNDYDGAHEKARDMASLDALDGDHFRVILPDQQSLSLEELVGQTQSYSVAPAPGEAKYEPMQIALRKYFSKWSAGGLITMETACEVAGWRGHQTPALKKP